jgi:hypothetical protein
MAEQDDKCPGCGAALKYISHVQYHSSVVLHYYECETVDCRDDWPHGDRGCTHKSLYVWISKECYRRQLVVAKAENNRLNELAEAQELHDTAIATLLRELGADDSEPRTKWVSLAIANLKRELIEAQAACAAMRDLVPVGCAICKWKDRNSDEAACAFCDNHYSKFEYAPNPGQPLLDDNARLNKLVEDLTKERDNLLASMKEETK